jgi:CRISPR-associated exonuclease Cas4
MVLIQQITQNLITSIMHRLEQIGFDWQTMLLVGGLLLFTTLIFALTRPTITMQPKAVTGQSFAKLIYTDEKGGTLLKAPAYGLQGKPDYIFQTFFRRKYIPYEIKSGTSKEDFPHEGDQMQLVAYFLIIQEAYGKKPPYGKLVYANKTFTIRNTRALRKQLLRYVEQMEETLEQGPTMPCVKSYIKCKNCICKDTVCTCPEEH